MNKNLNLCEILKDCPTGTKLWSPVWSNVTLIQINDTSLYPIVLSADGFNNVSLHSDGRMYGVKESECILFPSKEQRDWSKFERFWDKPKKERFDSNTLQPFDKVLVREFLSDNWMADFFEKIEENDRHYNVTCVTCRWVQCIPYNEETKHLLGTKEDCPEYYKWWEEWLKCKSDMFDDFEKAMEE